MEEKPFLEEKVLKDLFGFGLSIPNYQRPYKWRKEHVIQLLDDLYENIYQKKTGYYRIGSIIIHKNNSKSEIVDGQQRLTTFSLILHYLKSEGLLLQNHIYKNEISKNNINYNYQQIENWFRSKSLDAESQETKRFLNGISVRSQFVIINVFKQDEAFQLFDSQNSRGKSLYPHDLLKAFHLREMDKDGYSETDLEDYATKWEDYILTKDNLLLDILNNHLFRVRSWAKGQKKYIFTKHDLNEFKGISLYNENQYYYQLSSRILDGAVQNAKNDKLLRNFNISQKFPFQILMPIINGRNFFDYIFHYIELKKDVFENKNNEFGAFYQKNGYNYYGSWRSGDEKVRNLFENICLQFIDRFGKQNFEKIYYEEFYKNAYQLRLENKAINENSLMNHYKGQRFFKLIPNTYSPEELHSELFCNYNTNWEITKFVKGVEPIYEFVTNKKIGNG